MVFLSRAEVGSSNIIRSAFLINVLIKEIFCFSPPDILLDFSFIISLNFFD